MSGSNVVKVGEKSYAGVISLDDIESGNNIVVRFYVIWSNNDTNNEIDSLYGNNSMTFEIPIEINFIQYTGEEIIEYNG